MSVGVMTVGGMSVREITVGVMTVGVMTVGVMRRPQFYDYMYTCYLEIIKWTKILGQENKQDWIHF